MKCKVLLKGLALLLCLMILSTPTVLAGPLEGIFCNGDFDNDLDVDANDLTEFLKHFGRESSYSPCPPESVWKIFEAGTDSSVPWINHLDNPRFAIYDVDGDNDGTDVKKEEDLVLDKDTGLIWARNANLEGALTMDWYTAMDIPVLLPLGNTMGWRLPTIEELSSLVDTSQSSPTLPSGHPFIYVQDYYWSSTTNDQDSTYAWELIMSDGHVYPWTKDNADWNYCWPVYGGNGYATGKW